MSFKVSLLFVPGWTLVTGSPHLALPLLSAFLEDNGIDVTLRDLNYEVVNDLGIKIKAADLVEACISPTLASMNAPYFDAEDKLMAVASQYRGCWNAQLGFWFEGSPEKSSRDALASLASS